jgi:NTP pyrophosphatase (non-canonical NTP hydrolase)
MADREVTILELKERIMDLCRAKKWGKNGDGIQNPQHMAMAMSVEMGEMLEHFQWLEREDVEAMMNGDDPARVALIAEEFADMMIYGLQIMTVLGVDVSDQMIRKLEIVRNRPLKPTPKEEREGRR